MMAKLRGHHLICLQFYRGEGYSDEFVENLKKVVDTAKKHGILIVEGADDVCNHCPYLVGGKCMYRENADKEIRCLDSLAMALLKTAPGKTITWKEVEETIPEIIEEWREKACKSCDWREVCHHEICNKS